MSDTHEARVVRIGEVLPHPNAERLELTKIGGPEGYQMVIGKGSFKSGDLAVFIQPDSVVPQTEPFAFIWKDHVGVDGKVPERRRRIKPKKLRGEWSEGLLMPISELGLKPETPGDLYLGEVFEGYDVASIIGITRYEPLKDEADPDAIKAAPKRKYPRTLKGWFYFLLMKMGFRNAHKSYAMDVSFDAPVYDVNALKNARPGKGFREGERVQVTEKIHGQNARYVFLDGVQYCGSHEQWKIDGPNPWWNVYRHYPEIGEWCRKNPGKILYGEIGPCQKGFDYGFKKAEPFFMAFDVCIPEGHPDIPVATCNHWNWAGNEGFAPTVPILYVGPYNAAEIAKFVDGPSVVPGAKHIREGIVIRSLATGRRLKWVSNDYLKND